MFSIKNLKLQGITLASVIALTGCTLSEPKLEEGNAQDLLLTSVSSFGLTVMRFDYDNQNRITEINVSDGIKYSFSYSGNQPTPSTIESKEYEYFYLNGKVEKKLAYHTLWTNIQADSNGHITRMDTDDTQYSYSWEWDSNTDNYYVKETVNREIGVTTLTYNSKGQLTESIIWETGDEKNADHNYLNWENDLITWSGEGPGADHREIYTYEYSNVTNITRQWDPNNEVLGPLAISGFFGPAPSKYVKEANYYYSNQWESSMEYSYNIGSNGLIKSSKVLEDGNELLTFNFNYSKKR